MNADTNQPIEGCDPLTLQSAIDITTVLTLNLNVQAVTQSRVGSVQWSANGVVRLEHAAPWSLCGNQGTGFYACRRLQSGFNSTIQATPFAGPNATGMAGASALIQLSLVLPNGIEPVMSLTLLNADTDTEIGPLRNDTVIDLFKTPLVNVRANVGPLTQSVQFALDGRVVRVEYGAPFCLFGNTGNDYHPWTPSVGRFTIAAWAYSDTGAQGTVRSTTRVSVVVTNSSLDATRAPTVAPVVSTQTPIVSPVAVVPTRAPTMAPVRPVTVGPVATLSTTMYPTLFYDDQPPQLLNVTISLPVVDLKGNAVAVHLTLTVQDEPSGFVYALVSVDSLESQSTATISMMMRLCPTNEEWCNSNSPYSLRRCFDPVRTDCRLS